LTIALALERNFVAYDGYAENGKPHNI